MPEPKFDWKWLTSCCSNPCIVPLLLVLSLLLLLLGNGASDKPSIFSTRSRWWTIDDYVEKDVPTVIRFVLKETHSQQVHFLGHSMVRW